MKYCTRCGKEIQDGGKFCPGCGASMPQSYAQQPMMQQPYAQQPVMQQPMAQSTGKSSKGSIPAFVLGLIGAIFGLFGGLCVSACYSLSGDDGVPLLLMVGGSVIGLIGACLCFNKAKIGSLLEILGAVMIAICAFGITGADFMSLVGMAMLAVGGIVGLLTSGTTKG